MGKDEIKEIVKEVIQELNSQNNFLIKNEEETIKEITDVDVFTFDFKRRVTQRLNSIDFQYLSKIISTIRENEEDAYYHDEPRINFRPLSETISVTKENEECSNNRTRIVFPEKTEAEDLKKFLMKLMVGLKRNALNLLAVGKDRYYGPVIVVDNHISRVPFIVNSGHWRVELYVNFKDNKYESITLDVAFELINESEY